MMQMRQVRQVIREERTPRTAFAPWLGLAWRRIARVEHEVIDDDLPAAVEQVREAPFALLAVEHILLHQFDHRQPASLGVQRVAPMGEVLLPGEQLLALVEPFLARYDFGKSCHDEFSGSVGLVRSKAGRPPNMQSDHGTARVPSLAITVHGRTPLPRTGAKRLSAAAFIPFALGAHLDDTSGRQGRDSPLWRVRLFGRTQLASARARIPSGSEPMSRRFCGDVATIAP